MRINVSETDYNDNSTVYTNWYEVVNVGPDYDNVIVTPNQSGWGDNFTYSVEVSDTEGDNVNCTLYTSLDGGAWQYIDYYLLVGGVGFCNITITDYTCSEISENNYFKFGLDDLSNQINTTAEAGPNITKDNITLIHVYGDGEEVNRFDDDIGLAFFINDTVKQGGVSNPDLTLYFNITVNGTDYIEEGSNDTENGNVTYYFDRD